MPPTFVYRLSPWIDFSGLCPDCVPSERGEFNFRACYDCLKSDVDPIVPENACPICCQVLQGGACWNSICRVADRPFSQVFAIGYRSRGNLIYRLTYNLKFMGRAGNELPLGTLLAGHLIERANQYEGYDMIVPIPRTREKAEAEGDPVLAIYRRGRGLVSQAGPPKLAKLMPPVGRIPLRKVLDTGKSPDKSFADKKDFANSVLSGTSENPYVVPSEFEGRIGKRVLLVDDIFTTGYHTLALAAHAMRIAGAARVDGLVIGRQKAPSI